MKRKLAVLALAFAGSALAQKEVTIAY